MSFAKGGRFDVVVLCLSDSLIWLAMFSVNSIHDVQFCLLSLYTCRVSLQPLVAQFQAAWLKMLFSRLPENFQKLSQAIWVKMASSRPPGKSRNSFRPELKMASNRPPENFQEEFQDTLVRIISSRPPEGFHELLQVSSQFLPAHLLRHSRNY